MSTSQSDKAEPKPDFICVGAQKAGTGWLYEQLRDHPDFWMPPMKELHYFDRVMAGDESATQRSLPLARNEQDRFRIARERARDERDRDFLDRFDRISQREALDLEGYASLFAIKDDLIAGDITPGYSTLNETVVEKIVARFPTTKVIFIARDPVERAWSQLSMYVRRGLIEPFDADDLDRISEHLERPEIRARSFPSEIARRWRKRVNPDLFQVYFFDDLKRDPALLRAAIITFLGGNPNQPGNGLPPDHDTKAEKPKLLLTPSGQAHLADFFADELRACAEELGGPAAEWRWRYSV